MRELQQQNKKPINIYSSLVFFYVVSAIAFECTPETARISTLAIYAVFFAGLLYMYLHQKMKLNMYVVSIIVMSLYVYTRAFATTTSASTGLRTAYVFLTCSALCVVIFWLSIRYGEVIKAILSANILGSLILSARIIEAYGGIAEIIDRASNTDVEFRIGKLITNENAIGIFLASAVLASVTMLLIKKRKAPYKILIGLCIAIFVVMLLLTGSRKALLFAVAGTIFFLLLVYRKEKIMKKIVLWTMIAGALIGLVYLLRNVSIFGTIYKRFELLFEGLFGEKTYKTDRVREYMISTGLSDFIDSPFFGKGAGRSFQLFRTYSHNNFVELLMNYGVLGFMLYYVPYFLLLINLAKRSFRGDIYAMYFLVYITMQLVLGFGWVNYYDRTCQLVTAAAWGYLTGCLEREGRELHEGDQPVQTP